MKQLVNSWVEAELKGYRNTLGGAIKELNEECGMRINYSRLSEWRRGLYAPASRGPNLPR